jgi:hypothetical protein
MAEETYPYWLFMICIHSCCVYTNAGILCGVSLVVGLIFTTRAGEYYVKLFDSYAGSYGLLSVAFFEVIGVIYVYGCERYKH